LDANERSWGGEVGGGERWKRRMNE